MSGVAMHRRTIARAVLLLAIAGAVGAAACTEIGTNPETPAAIELSPFPSPSVVVGDTLRDLDGRVAPVRAIVRNVRGDEIAGADVQYLYADFARDSSLTIDPSTGIVFARKAATADARIAARVGSTLQVLRTLAVTDRPDSLDRGATVPRLLCTTPPDTGRAQAQLNSSEELTVNVRSIASATSVIPVNAWPVRFILPANPSNDTTRAFFLVDGNGRPSTLDTTDRSGVASRRVRVRAAAFPAGTGSGIDSLTVRATASYRGQRLRGDTVSFTVRVRRKTSSTDACTS